GANTVPATVPSLVYRIAIRLRIVRATMTFPSKGSMSASPRMVAIARHTAGSSSHIGLLLVDADQGLELAIAEAAAALELFGDRVENAATPRRQPPPIRNGGEHVCDVLGAVAGLRDAEGVDGSGVDHPTRPTRPLTVRSVGPEVEPQHPSAARAHLQRRC